MCNKDLGGSRCDAVSVIVAVEELSNGTAGRFLQRNAIEFGAAVAHSRNQTRLADVSDPNRHGRWRRYEEGCSA